VPQEELQEPKKPGSLPGFFFLHATSRRAARSNLARALTIF
jgi:hypothetical protein